MMNKMIVANLFTGPPRSLISIADRIALEVSLILLIVGFQLRAC